MSPPHHVPLCLLNDLPCFSCYGSSAIRFTTFERVSGWLQEGQGKVHAINALAAGTVAGVAESATCLTPLQNIQIKMMQMDRYDSCRHA